MACGPGDGTGRGVHGGGRQGRAASRIPLWAAAALAGTGLGAPQPAQAGDWTITPRVSARETYSDNINLAPSGQEEDDLVTDLNLGLSLRGEGRRLSMNLDYNLQAIVTGQDATNINHQLQADGQSELVESLVFVDFSSRIAQRNAVNTGRQATTTVSDTGNLIDTFSYQVSPFVPLRFKSYADAELRYTFDQVLNEGSSVDSSSHQIDVTADSGSRFQRFGWGFDYNRQHVSNQDSATQDNTRFERVEGTVSYRLTGQFSVFATGGFDNNDFETQGGEDDSGPTWSVGGTWSPSRRTTLQATYGERFFGEFVTFSLQHRSRRTIWQASLTEDTTLTRTTQLQRVLIPLTDPFGNPILNPFTGTQIRIPLDFATPTDEVIVSRRFDGSVSFQGRRTTLTLSGFQEERDFRVSSEDDETVVGSSASLSRQLSRQTSVNLFGSWIATDFRADERDDTRWDVGLSVSRQLGPDLNGQLRYDRTQNNSGLDSDEFTENRVSALVSLSF